MFKLKPNPTFWAKVEIPVPGADPDFIEFEFRHKSRDEVKRLGEMLAARPAIEVLHEVVADWRGVDAEFTSEALERLVSEFLSAPDQIIEAYLDEMRGARRKNLSRSPGSS